MKLTITTQDSTRIEVEGTPDECLQVLRAMAPSDTEGVPARPCDTGVVAPQTTDGREWPEILDPDVRYPTGAPPEYMRWPTTIGDSGVIPLTVGDSGVIPLTVDGITPKPRALTLSDVRKSADNAAKRVATWPQWKRDLSV